jgi:hypothetical protein
MRAEVTPLQPLAAQTKAQSNAAGPARRINGRFAKGYSGNPAGHKTFAANQALAQKRSAELFRALIAELGGKVSAVDMAFASQAAAMLAKAEISTKHRVHLTTKAGAIIDRLRARYPQSKRIPTLKELGL